jgi:hypothetical protein
MKTTMHGVIVAAFVAILLLLFISGCGSSGDSDGNNGGGEAVSGTPIDAGLPTIDLIAPETTAAGEVPFFEWEPVEGAARYRLVVLDGSGTMLWAWSGAETKVNLGGLPGERPEGVSGPVINAASSWSVVAFDANGKALAVSIIRPVSP